MRVGVLSDIHANQWALKAVLDELATQDIDHIIIAGDLVGSGPAPNETVELIRAIAKPTSIIRGNTDGYSLALEARTAPDTWWTSLQWAFTRWTHSQLTRASLEFLKGLPSEMLVTFPECDPIQVVHQSPHPDINFLLPFHKPENVIKALEKVIAPVLISGHTHESWIVNEKGRVQGKHNPLLPVRVHSLTLPQRYAFIKLLMNPGPISMPSNLETGAQYGVLTWMDDHWEGELCSVPYDLAPVSQAFQDSGFLEEGGAMARGVLYCIETGTDQSVLFLDYAMSLAYESGLRNFTVVPDNFWLRAEETFDWEAAKTGTIPADGYKNRVM